MTTPAKRLKYIRNELIKLSRSDIYKKYGLPPDTLSAWETGKLPLSEKGVTRCIKIFAAENILVSREWLLTGEGLQPNFSFELNRYFNNIQTEPSRIKVDDTLLLAKEIEFFRSLSPNAVTAMIATEDMLPLYVQGDYVGGRYRYKKEIENCIGKDCIIKTKDNSIYIRRVIKNSKGKKYNLTCLNPNWNGSPEPVIFNVEIESAAPIIWHRRLDNYS